MNEKDFIILSNINNNTTTLSQRELAQNSGLSLGMTNAILKRLVQKGLLTIKKINNRNIRYAVTPSGMEEITRRSYKYFKRTLKNVTEYKDKIDNMLLNVKSQGYNSLVLIGTSDLDFLIEFICTKEDIKLIKNDNDINKKTFMLYSESYIPDEAEKKEGILFLQDIFV